MSCNFSPANEEVGIDAREQLVQALEQSVRTGPATLDAALRDAIAHRAGMAPRATKPDEVPEALRTYVDKVAHCAHMVVDEDFEALRAAGYDDDAIFEITISAAVGAGCQRLKLGLGALRGDS